MNINKTKLKERLLEIPFNNKAYREKHSLANDLDTDLETVGALLNELVEKNILKEKIQYICHNCHDTTIMDDELLKEILEEGEDEYFPCDNCMEYINSENDRTGRVFYDVKDKEALKNWQ